MPLLAFDPDFSVRVQQRAHAPHGGLLAVWFALTNCVHVDLYGFHFRPGYDERITTSTAKPKKGKVAIHDYDLEYQQSATTAAIWLAEPCVSGCPRRRAFVRAGGRVLVQEATRCRCHCRAFAARPTRGHVSSMRWRRGCPGGLRTRRQTERLIGRVYPPSPWTGSWAVSTIWPTRRGRGWTRGVTTRASVPRGDVPASTCRNTTSATNPD